MKKIKLKKEMNLLYHIILKYRNKIKEKKKNQFNMKY